MCTGVVVRTYKISPQNSRKSPPLAKQSPSLDFQASQFAATRCIFRALRRSPALYFSFSSRNTISSRESWNCFGIFLSLLQQLLRGQPQEFACFPETPSRNLRSHFTPAQGSLATALRLDRSFRGGIFGNGFDDGLGLQGRRTSHARPILRPWTHSHYKWRVRRDLDRIQVRVLFLQIASLLSTMGMHTNLPVHKPSAKLAVEQPLLHFQ